MTTSEPRVAEIAAETSEVGESCAACAHPWQAHDALGVRFCTATLASSISRGCICE